MSAVDFTESSEGPAVLAERAIALRCLLDARDATVRLARRALGAESNRPQQTARREDDSPVGGLTARAPWGRDFERR